MKKISQSKYRLPLSLFYYLSGSTTYPDIGNNNNLVSMIIYKISSKKRKEYENTITYQRNLTKIWSIYRIQSLFDPKLTDSSDSYSSGMNERIAWRKDAILPGQVSSQLTTRHVIIG